MMLGIDIKSQRDMMVEALEVILPLLRGEEVTHKTSWFTLNKARVHLRPYTYPHPEIAVASAITPSGGMLAGKLRLRHALRRRDRDRRASTCSARTGRSPTRSPPSTARPWTRAGCAWSCRCTSPRRARRRAPMSREGLSRWCEYFDRVAPKGMARPARPGRSGRSAGQFRPRGDRHAGRRDRDDRAAAGASRASSA